MNDFESGVQMYSERMLCQNSSGNKIITSILIRMSSIHMYVYQSIKSFVVFINLALR